ncbi:MAG: FKBP-type peptidyl-prolyl cis-trans isomerase [Coxiellaceae bacterium]|nr:FKBP-type peptidyl-prolyl cis-trans isomerase [Coxiellaceae bacterium]
MKKLVIMSSGVLLATSVFAADLTTQTQKLSYTIGYKTGMALKAQSININAQDFNQGLQAGYQGDKSSLTNQEMQSTLETMQKQVSNNMQQQAQAEGDINKKAGEAFLAKNAKEAGVVTLPSGLQYRIVHEGNGANPKASDTVTVNYEGTLIDGTVFDSSYKRGQPATFKVGQVIAGWQEALKLMKPGATWMLYIPSNLAYGSHGAGAAIGPNETLIFKVDLLSVK